MNEDTQYRLLFDDPVRLFESTKYKKVLKSTVKKFAAQKLQDEALSQELLQKCQQSLYTEVLPQIQQDFKPDYNLLLPFFQRIIYAQCVYLVERLTPH
ncbi:hypothetical protein [Microscilla marina]|uniref:Uncharacterized protein n=1 Tax=Microscilla marina ATCC 23134 TaxID=313606 RepID=A1ZM90_MICM2|nr:hypothetical protein [Microscilla marina]EAY28622.1 hypothetical protein M23134_04469 [Microscilla marina ATCC 23134]